MLFKYFKLKHKSTDKNILGHWILDPEDMTSLEIYGNISIQFKANSELIYTIHSDNRDQIILMTYEIKGGILITDQPSSPQKEQTKFNLVSKDRLELFFGGEKSSYIRK